MGHLNGTHFRGIKQCKGMVILRDFPYISCLGWWYYDHCFLLGKRSPSPCFARGDFWIYETLWNIWLIFIEHVTNAYTCCSNVQDFSNERCGLHPGRLTCNITMEVWKIIVLSKWLISRFHVNLPGCNLYDPVILVWFPISMLRRTCWPLKD